MLSQSQDAPLPPLLRARVSMHLMTCAACRNFDKQLRFLRAAMRRVKVDRTAAAPVAGPRP